MQVLCSLLVALVYCSFANAVETLEVVAGEPFILNFGYSGPKVGISSDLTKDGETVTADSIRTFMQHDNLYFAEIDELDSGEYHFTVTGNGVNFEKTIIVSVTKNTDSKSPEFYTPELAILKAIAEEQKEIVKRSSEVEDSLPTTNNIPLRNRRRPNSVTVKHGDARAMVERILTRARKQTQGPFPVVPFFPLGNFTQCIQPPTPGNCSAYFYRTADGTCNNLYNPMWGSVNRAFRRLQNSEYVDGIYVPVGADQVVNGTPFDGPWPSPRRISRVILTDANENNNGFSMFFTLFGQAIALDNTRFGTYQTQCPMSCNNYSQYLPFCFPIPVEPEDMTYGNDSSNNGSCLAFTRAIGECRMPFDDTNATYTMSREQINELTHYLDASGIYGSTAEETAMVRNMTGGRLQQSRRTENYRGDLPILPEDEQFGMTPPFFFFAGDIRVENYVHQIVMYTLLYRMHNAIVDQLAEINSCWNDERLFQEGRKIVGGIWQAIIYREYLPLLFRDQFDTYIGNYPGYNTSVDATVPIAFAVGAGRFGHSMFQDPTARLDSNGDPLPIGPLNLRDAFFNATEYYTSGGVDPLTRGMLQDESKELDRFLIATLTNRLFAPRTAPFGMDLASLNIQRARDHGIPSYRSWQRYCQERYTATASFTNDAEQRLRSVYGDAFDTGMDLWVGGLMENKLSDMTPLGPTFACIIGQTYRNLRDGDRFYWENPDVFTQAQRESIAQMTIARLICANSDNITSIRPEAFTLGGTPVQCNTLPYVDLNLWREDPCDPELPTNPPTTPTTPPTTSPTTPPTTAGPSGASTTCSLGIVYLFMAIVSFLFALF